jgi:hypothetical protein
MDIKHPGGCLCGSVRYRATGASINDRICHCHLCQKALGASFNARMLFKIDNVAIEGPVAYINSSEGLKRGFCPKCGSTLFSRRETVGVMGITVGSLDDASAFKPQMHIYVASKQPWVKINDGLPQYDGPPPP